MASIEIRNLTEVRAMLARLGSDQIPYATMIAVNNVAFAVREQQTQRLPQVFDRPTPMIRGAVRVVKATKDSLTATVAIDPPRAVALQAHESGGRRNVQKLEAALRNRGLLPVGMVVVPVAVDLDAYGNPRRAAVNQVVNWLATGAVKRKRAGFFVITQQQRTKIHAGLDPGIYYASTGRIFGEETFGLSRWFAFTREPNYSRRLGFVRTGKQEVLRLLPMETSRAIQRAIETAR